MPYRNEYRQLWVDANYPGHMGSAPVRGWIACGHVMGRKPRDGAKAGVPLVGFDARA